MRFLAIMLGCVLSNATISYTQNVHRQILPESLGIGDPMPDLIISNVQNFTRSQIKFSDFKNKLVILDFWFGTCKSCILNFPKMEALQKKFKDQIQILMVNFESQGTIETTFRKWKNIP